MHPSMLQTHLETTQFHSDVLTHWGRVTHICVCKPTIIGWYNGLSPDRRQAIIWTNVGILLMGPLGTNFSDILTGIQTFSFKKMLLKMSSAKWRPFCLGLNVLMGHWIHKCMSISQLTITMSKVNSASSHTFKLSISFATRSAKIAQNRYLWPNITTAIQNDTSIVKLVRPPRAVLFRKVQNLADSFWSLQQLSLSILEISWYHS